jgi:CelD/BcsL family acetyltransferase involved in cellulose biosynthesis
LSSEAVAQTSKSAGIQIESIQDSAALTGLRGEWLEVWSELPDTTVFQSPDWLLPWWSQYGEGPMLSFAFRCEGRLVGVAPCYIYGEAVGQPRQVFLIGTGNSDYLDVIFRPEFQSDCWKELLAELQARSNLWDACDFQQLGSNSPLRQNPEYARAFVPQLDEQEPCLVLDLCSLDSSLAMEKQASYYRRMLEKSGSFVTVEARPDSFDEIFTALERLHENRWRGRGLSGAFSSERDRKFHRSAAQAFLTSRVLRLYGARLNGKIIATLYGLCHRERTYFYLSGFDPEYAAFSVGTVLLGHAIEEARKEGCDAFDFLRGREPYKYRWGAREQASFRMRLLKKEQGGSA